MRKFSFPLLCFILLPSLVWSQAASKLSPRVRPFVREDTPKIALTHVRVIDGTGTAARADQTLLIEDGKIAAMGDAATTRIPDGTKTLDLTARTVIPGLVGMHDHMYYPSPGRSLPLYPEHASSFPRLYLAGGVTSIRTTGSIETYTDLELKLAIDQGKMAGPRIQAFWERARALAAQFTSLDHIWKAKGRSLHKCANSQTPRMRGAPSNTGSRK